MERASTLNELNKDNLRIREGLGKSIICPICSSPMLVDLKTWRCDGSKNDKRIQHSFDVARQGYLNLLPVHHKKSKQPGDSSDSITCRQKFLQAGFYQPLQDTIMRMLTKHTDTHDIWLDVGCGDGYYTLPIATLSQQTLAIDISKPAVMTVAKTCKKNNLLWSQQRSQQEQQSNRSILPLVASASNLPIKTNSIDGISSIFSPILPSEYARVLHNNGSLVIAKPDEGHLESIRHALFDETREHNSDKFLIELYKSGFDLVEKAHVQTQLALTDEHLRNLLTMTPYSYRAKKHKRDALLQQTIQSGKVIGFVTQAKFIVYLLKIKK